MATEDQDFSLPTLPSENLRILTVDDVATLLRVPKTWVYEHSRLRGRRRIPHKKLGKYLRFAEQEVQAWFASLPGY
jgi:excisionase family DNA binding protein